jgi:hypothetical protein
MKRLPIIRHIRWLITAWKIERHYAVWLELGFLPVHRASDDAHLDDIWSGKA